MGSTSFTAYYNYYNTKKPFGQITGTLPQKNLRFFGITYQCDNSTPQGSQRFDGCPWGPFYVSAGRLFRLLHLLRLSLVF